MKLKTEFWEKINNEKVMKILFYISIITITDTIAFIALKTIPLAIINGLISLFLLMVQLSYNKWEEKEHERRKTKPSK